jgi:uncharacterized membrane protein YfcA
VSNTLIFGLVVSGLIGGAILGSTGVIGPFLIPALLLLGFSSDVTRGTCLLSELLMTVVSVFWYKKARNLDKHVILAFMPGAVTVFFGALVSVRLSESFMTLAIGVFEVILGAAMIYATIGRADKQYSRTVVTRSVMAKLMVISVFAGFAKGFFGAGWGPLGVGLFVLLGIDPAIAVGSSLTIRLLLDCVGGLTYASMNMIDLEAAAVLTIVGCLSVPLAVKFTKMLSGKNFTRFLGVVIAILGLLVVIEK